MAKPKYRIQKQGRDSNTGRWMPVPKAKRQHATATVDSIRHPIKRKRGK